MATVCLSMIVKNETKILHECLDSVHPHIDYWVIVDTGSTDGTQDYIRNYFAEKGIPGELIERPWVDFGHNRTEALDLCVGKGDYAWMIDADDKIVGNFNIPKAVIENKVDSLTFLELLLRKGLATDEEIDEIRAAVVAHLNVMYPDLRLSYATPLPLAEQAPFEQPAAKGPGAPLFIEAPPPKFL